MRVYPAASALVGMLKIWLFIVSRLSQVGVCGSYDSYDEPPCLTTVNSHGGYPPPPPPPPPPTPSSLHPSSSPSLSLNFPAQPGINNSTLVPPMPSPAGSSSSSGLHVGFYSGKCFDKHADVEAIIATEVKAQFDIDPTLLPALLRLQFHDCFVTGCDASILIEGNSTEKSASPNHSVRGYTFVDAVKLVVEAQCPGLVSCADIIAVSTKALIKLGGGPDYPVQTGRRDGLVSQAEDARDLPSPFLSVEDIATAFAAKNFTIREMVVLLGCHTVGVAHCVFFRDRLYPGTALFDPLMDPDLHSHLTSTCPQSTTAASNNFTLLDQNLQNLNTVDNSYFNQIINQRGVLPIDQKIAQHPKTQDFVQQLSLNTTLFNIELANAMVKLQALDVLTGNQGEVRNICSRVN